MKRGKLEQRALEAAARRIADALAKPKPNDNGVLRFAEDFKLDVPVPVGGVFTVAARGATNGLRGVLVLQADEAIISTLQLYLSFVEEWDLPEAERLKEAETRTIFLLQTLLERGAQSLADMLDVLLNEALIVSSHLVQYADDEGYPPQEADAPPLNTPGARIILKYLEEKTKRRLNARGRGAGPSVMPATVFRAVIENGGEDAKAKDVAKALNITDRQLRALRADYGFDNWPELVGHALRMAKRK